MRLGGHAGRQRAAHLAHRHDVGPRPQLAEQADHRQARVGLHGVADFGVHALDAVGEFLPRRAQRAGRVAVERRADLGRDGGERHAFGVHLAVLVGKESHRPALFASQETAPGLGHGAHDVGGRGAAQALARIDRRLDGQHAIDAAIDLGLDRLHLGERQLVEIDALVGGDADQPAGDVMGLAERQADLADQPVGKIGRHRIIGRGDGAHALGVGLEVAHHAGHRRDAELQRIGGVEQRLLVLLHVLAVGERQALEDGAQRHEGADDAADLGARQFGGIGIALLRHDRAAGGEGVGQGDEAERCRAPDHDLLRQARQVHRRERGRGDELHDVVAVGHRIERVGHRPLEAQRLGRLARIDRMRRAGERGRPQRRFVQPRAAIGETATVAAEHLDIGHQVMAEGDGLRRLQMGEARHDGRGIFVGAIDQRGLQVGQHRLQAIDRVAHPQPDIERDLVVARARRVQATAGRTDQVGQPALDVEMDVLELGGELEAAGLRSPRAPWRARA